MREKLKPCPFCPDGGDLQLVTFTGGADDVVRCHECGTILKHKIWQIRPIEDELQKRIAELEESDKHWAGNVKVCMQLIERYESDIAELEEIDRMRSESVSTLNQANANNEDEIELLEKRIAKLKAKNETLKTACDILRSDNNILFKRLMAIKTPDNTKKNTIVYRREGEE